MPGQNVAGGEEPHPLRKEHRLHHALRFEAQGQMGVVVYGKPLRPNRQRQVESAVKRCHGLMRQSVDQVEGY